MSLHYIAPFIYPLFPGEERLLRFIVPMQRLLDNHSVAGLDFELNLSTRKWANGTCLRQDDLVLAVRNGRVERPEILLEEKSEYFGYIETEITASIPMFHSVLYEIGYGMITTPMGQASVIEMPKFADPRVIRQIRETGRYSLAHTAAMVDQERNLDDYFLVINPYSKAIVVRLFNSRGDMIRRTVPNNSTLPISLREILRPGLPEAVFLSAPQRVIAYDVRAPFDHPEDCNTVDHLDPFRGEAAFIAGGWKRYIRSTLRRFQFNRRYGLS